MILNYGRINYKLNINLNKKREDKNMARAERIIWSDIDINEKDWQDEDGEQMEYEDIIELNNDYLDDERINLNIQLSNPILVIGSLGLWDGRKSGYKIIKSGNIKDILYSENDYTKWYSDGYNIKCLSIHHDGRNYYEYREIRNMDNIDNLLDKLYNQEEVSREYINRYTRSILSDVKKVYGW